MTMELSIIAQFEELRRCSDVLQEGTTEMEFLKFVQLQDECRLQWLKAVQEAPRLQRELDNALRGMSDLESKLFHARKLLEEENKARRHAEHEWEAVEKKMNNDINSTGSFLSDLSLTQTGR